MTFYSDSLTPSQYGKFGNAAHWGDWDHWRATGGPLEGHCRALMGQVPRCQAAGAQCWMAKPVSACIWRVRIAAAHVCAYYWRRLILILKGFSVPRAALAFALLVRGITYRTSVLLLGFVLDEECSPMLPYDVTCVHSY